MDPDGYRKKNTQMSMEQRKQDNEDEIDRRLKDLIGRIEGELVSDEILELAAKLQEALKQRRDLIEK